jgi:hypothetical protein
MKATCFLVLLAACGGGGGSFGALETIPVPPTETGRDGVHGMILFGDGDRYLSHIPMFHEPHDAQLVMRVRLANGEGDLPKRYGDRLYTIEPERFRLDEVFTGERRSFKANIYRGNFEDGGTKIGSAEFQVQAIVVARPLEDSEADDQYYVFGSGKEWWALHRVGTAPSYDSLSRITLARRPVPGLYRVPGTERLTKGSLLEGEGNAILVTEAHEMVCLVGPKFTDACQ